jgi:hypothetical protein
MNASKGAIEQYRSVIKNAVVKIDGHKQKELPLGYENCVRLYAINTLCYSERNNITRCVAMCSEWKRAIEIVESNEGDIFEYACGLVVIEPTIDNAVYGHIGGEVYWYMWQGLPDVDGSGYRAIETPEEYKNIIGWGVG